MNTQLDHKTYLHVGNRVTECIDISDAAAVWVLFVESTGLGASQIPVAPIIRKGRETFYPSYNGRVWDRPVSENGRVCVYDPYTDSSLQAH